MPARNAEKICGLFKQFMAEGDVNGLLSVYDPEVVFVNEAGDIVNGKQEMKEQLAPLAPAQPRFDFLVKQIVQSGGIALMHTLRNISSPRPMSTYAIEVACRQPDGTWRWLIGDSLPSGDHWRPRLPKLLPHRRLNEAKNRGLRRSMMVHIKNHNAPQQFAGRVREHQQKLLSNIKTRFDSSQV